MSSGPRWLRMLLLALPRTFRDEYRDEIGAHVAWMRARQGSLPGGAGVIVSVAFDVLRVGLTERLTTGWTTWSRSPRLSGRSLAGGALLTFVGGSLGFGAGLRVGFALVPPALLLFALGMLGRASATPGPPRRTSWPAGWAAACAALLAAQVTLRGFSVDLLGLTAPQAMLPAFVGFIAGSSLLSTIALVRREVPALPAAAAALGGLLLLAGPLDLGRIAELGFWLWAAGWAALGVAPWAGPSAAPLGQRLKPT